MITNLIVAWLALNAATFAVLYVNRVLLAGDGERQEKLVTIIDHVI